MLSLCRSESLVTFGLVVELMLLHLTRSTDLDALLLEWSAAHAVPARRCVLCAAALAVELWSIPRSLLQRGLAVTCPSTSFQGVTSFPWMPVALGLLAARHRAHLQARRW
jgi:hypothetical protein